MNCTSPYILNIPGYTGIPVPCRNCMQCRIARSSEWAMRISHEYLTWEHGVFITLTYDEEHIPENYSLVKADLQKFFKRLRHHIGKERKVKYFACGEYGDKRGRPHYHAIILGLRIEEHQLERCPRGGWYVMGGVLKDAWDKGLIHVGEVTEESIGYVTHYIDKKLTGKLADEHYKKQNRSAPFQLQSQGFGLAYALQNKKNISENLRITYRGKFTPIPSYYRLKLGLDKDPRFSELAKEKTKQQVEEHLKRENISIDSEEYKRITNLMMKRDVKEFAFKQLSQEEIVEIYDTFRAVNESYLKSRQQHNTNLKHLYRHGKEFFEDIF